MRKTTIYCLAGCCVTLAAIGLVKTTSSEIAASSPRDSKIESVRKRNSIRPTPLALDPKDESTYSRRGIGLRAAQEAPIAEVAEVSLSPEAKASVATELEEEISRLAQSGVEGAEVLPGLLEKALSTPEDNSDDLSFMAAYHKVRTAAPATTQEN